MVGVPCLTRCPAGPLLADVLAERALAQERDERAAAEHRQERGQHARTEHVRHSAASVEPLDAGRARALEQHDVARPQHAREQVGGLGNVGRPVPFAALGRRRVPGASSPTPITTSMPRRAQARPASACQRGASGPSSAIVPSTATVRAPPARSTSAASALSTETGLAL